MGLAWCEAGGSQLRPQGFASQPHSLSSVRQRLRPLTIGGSLATLEERSRVRGLEAAAQGHLLLPGAPGSRLPRWRAGYVPARRPRLIPFGRFLARLGLVGLEALSPIHDVGRGVRLGASDSYRAESEVRPGFATPRKPFRTRQTRRVESDIARGLLWGLGRVVWPLRRYTRGSGLGSPRVRV
jgi:hypothetical protein